MKLAVISSHLNGDIDPTLSATLLKHLPTQVTQINEADAVLVPISYHHNFIFNSKLRGIRKPIIILDFLEYFGAHSHSTHLLGSTPLPTNMQDDGQWRNAHEWAAHNPPALYFKRELLKQDVTDRVQPIEWPCTHAAWGIEPKDRFDVRPFQVFYNWGYSNALRPRLAGEIYGLMAEGKIEVIASFDHIDAKINEPQPKWVSIHSPHTHRTHIDTILRRQAQSKMSVSMPGAGVKCFRSQEAPLHTVPVMVADETAWSHPWKHGENCIKINPSPLTSMAQQLWEETQSDALHCTYVAAQENIDRYRTHRYIHEYILPTIKRCL